MDITGWPLTWSREWAWCCVSPPRTLAICVDHVVCGGSTSKSSWFLCVEGHCVWNLTGLCLENSQALLQ